MIDDIKAASNAIRSAPADHLPAVRWNPRTGFWILKLGPNVSSTKVSIFVNGLAARFSLYVTINEAMRDVYGDDRADELIRELNNQNFFESN